MSPLANTTEILLVLPCYPPDKKNMHFFYSPVGASAISGNEWADNGDGMFITSLFYISKRLCATFNPKHGVKLLHDAEVVSVSSGVSFFASSM